MLGIKVGDNHQDVVAKLNTGAKGRIRNLNLAHIDGGVVDQLLQTGGNIFGASLRRKAAHALVDSEDFPAVNVDGIAGVGVVLRS